MKKIGENCLIFFCYNIMATLALGCAIAINKGPIGVWSTILPILGVVTAGLSTWLDLTGYVTKPHTQRDLVTKKMQGRTIIWSTIPILIGTSLFTMPLTTTWLLGLGLFNRVICQTIAFSKISHLGKQADQELFPEDPKPSKGQKFVIDILTPLLKLFPRKQNGLMSL